MSAKSRHGKRVPQHRYLDTIAELHKRGAFKPGQVTLMDIAHDTWCDTLRGGVCRCNPDLRIRHHAGAHATN